MPAITGSRNQTTAVLGSIGLLAGIILWISPSEQSLGSGIKVVYLHVALTWTGMAALLVAGLLGLGAAVFSRPRLQQWAHNIVWVGLVVFCAGLAMSLAASSVNWGGVFLQEPRTFSALQVVAAGLIVQIASSWSNSYRLKGFLYFLLALYMLWSTRSAELILHPGDAARTSSSAAIRLTFLGLFVAFSLAAAWVVLLLQRYRTSS